MRPALMLALMFSLCCSGAQQTADARVRSALDMLAVTVDPAYRMAMDACMVREQLIAEQAERETIPLLEAHKQLGLVRATCSRRRQVFELIREGHDEAAQLVEKGAVEDAEHALERVRTAWRDDAILGEVP
jgi:hypothetical protein